MDSTINASEKLYRAIRNNMRIREDGSLPAAAFIDAGGVSVDRDGQREENMIITAIAKCFHKDIVTIARLTCQECLDKGVLVKATPSKPNKYHAEIHEPEKRGMSNQRKAVELAKCATLIPIK